MNPFQFSPSELDSPRKPGISAIMRIKNGEDFLEASIESHLPFYDEIVACYNGCTDNTASILEKLARRHPEKIRVFHYEPDVAPPYSPQHDATPTESIHSLANYYNFALARARYSVATKLDDDHIAITENLAPAIATIRAHLDRYYFFTFSGINVTRDAGGEIGVLEQDPFVGTGDHFYFPVCSRIYFQQTRCFEKLVIQGPKPFKQYLGILYWHLKFLKPGFGLHNWDATAASDAAAYLEKHRRLIRFTDFASPRQIATLQKRFNPVEFATYRNRWFQWLLRRLANKTPPLRIARQLRLNQDLAAIDFCHYESLLRQLQSP